jgi:anti-anti-sigma factor
MSGEWQILEIAGEVDLATVGDVERAVKGVFDDGASALALDLSGTTFMDSTGLRTLVVADRQFREDGRAFAVVVQPGPITRLMDLSGLDSSLTIVGSLDDLS